MATIVRTDGIAGYFNNCERPLREPRVRRERNNISDIELQIALCITGSITYNLYFHPLAKYPGPFWAKVSLVGQARAKILRGRH